MIKYVEYSNFIKRDFPVALFHNKRDQGKMMVIACCP